MNSLKVSSLGARFWPKNEIANAASTNPSIPYQNRLPDDGAFSGRRGAAGGFGLEGFGDDDGSEFGMVTRSQWLSRSNKEVALADARNVGAFAETGQRRLADVVPHSRTKTSAPSILTSNAVWQMRGV